MSRTAVFVTCVVVVAFLIVCVLVAYTQPLSGS
jgi:hypothetical protein